MHNIKSVQENATPKVLRDFEIQTDRLILARRQTKTKRSCQIVDSFVPADHSVKLKESEKRDKYLDWPEY